MSKGLHLQQEGSKQNKFDLALEKIDKILPLMKEEARVADRNNSFPVKNFELIKNEGLLNLSIPTYFGGFGLDFLQYQHAIIRLAEGCPATAASLNMHCIVLGALADISYDDLNEEQKQLVIPYVKKFFSRVTEEQKVFASATSEPSIGARYSKTKTTYQRVEGGYLINGIKSFVTMADYADFYSIIATQRTENTEEKLPNHYLTFFIVPREQSGIEIIRNWDTIGMRATQSHQVVFNDVFIPEKNAFMGITGFGLIKIMQAPHWVTGGYLGVYLGIMKSALDFTIDYIKERTNKETKTGLGYDPLIQVNIAKLHNLYKLAYYATFKAAELVIRDPFDRETHQALYLAKYVVGEHASQLTTLAMKTCGGMTIHKKYDLERYLRDSMCASLMPVVSAACELFVGKSLLDLPTDTIW